MALILISALSIRVLMDICFKLSVQNVSFVSLNGFFPTLLKVVFRWPFLVAILTSILNFWLWMMVLSHYDLSFAYPMFGLCFALIMVSGKLFFGEYLDKYKLIGIGFILLSSLVLIIE
tara:strand:+ start:226 stop:579 length:354 start_codon:yes stop_codon:yes gene_type:complete